MKNYKNLKVTIGKGRADIIMDRPPYNILNIEMMNEMIDCLDALSKEPTLCVVVITSAGKAFSAGVDVGEHKEDMVEEMISTFSRLFKALWSVPAVTVAAVTGSALGGGCEVAIGCDIVLASEAAKFGQPEVAVGVFPPMAVAVFPKLIGRNLTIEWLLSGDIYSAQQAYEIGLINRVFLVDSFKDDLDKYCKKFTRQSAAVLALTKKALDITYEKNARDGMKLADNIYLEELMKTKDAREGLTAFLEKRKPVWGNH